MRVIQNLLQSIDCDAEIRRITSGVHWTAVSSRGCGMASTITGNKPHGDDVVREAGNLERKSAKEIAHYLNSENPLEASIGLASLNSLIDVPRDKLIRVNAFKVLIEKSIGKTAALFGHFPYISEFRKAAGRLTVFELNPDENEHNMDEVPKLLPEAEIVAITSNSIINHTIKFILPYIKSNAFTVMVGPSTPLSPILFDFGISMLSGVIINDEKALYQSISQGAIFRQVKGAELVCWQK